MRPQLFKNPYLTRIPLGKQALLFLSAILLFVFTACEGIQAPKTKPFLGDVKPPKKQEFRWSNGKLPKSFDPVLAAAAPETDVVRAIFEGLTEIDAKTLKAQPGVAKKWEHSNDFKTWTFELRTDAKWSNGKTVTAHDFLRSWQRVIRLGDKAPQYKLFANIEGIDTAVFSESSEDDFDAFGKLNDTDENVPAPQSPPANLNPTSTNAVGPKPNDTPNLETANNRAATAKVVKLSTRFGIEAESDFALKITLKMADRDFPALVAHPVFFPVFDDKALENNNLNSSVVTNGPFRVSEVTPETLVLERSETYWNKDSVKLETVRFVPAENAETALAAYRAGEVDAITNARFEPLGIKLLKPFDEFDREKHGALNLYEFNHSRKPFDDIRVRQALAMSIERSQLTDDEMDGATEPAYRFLPFGDNKGITQDFERAKQLLAEAGFAGGQNFPRINLLINRNDTQKNVARQVAKMWKKNLNIETEIIVKDKADFDETFRKGEFDLVRRGVVLPTSDKTAGMFAIFGSQSSVEEAEAIPNDESNTTQGEETVAADNDVLPEPANSTEEDVPKQQNADKTGEPNEPRILTEKEALEQLPGIPLYFPTSYSLVKPYIHGFETNALDAPSLKKVVIDFDWQPQHGKTVSNKSN